ncbi:MAG: tetratricopeptide repeat protein [Nitrospinae bacterium]|nr:tetratricopeptide repeat protein [Nitrospinota bacterium]
MRVLVAVPHESYRETFVTYLLTLPLGDDAPLIEYSEDGIAALALIQKRTAEGTPFDLIIADQHLPGARGAQIVHFMRFDEAHQWVPVLLFHVEGHPACLEEMKAAGVKEFMTLPLNYDDFQTRLTRMTDVAIWEEEAARTTRLDSLYFRREHLVENEVRDAVYLHSLERVRRIRRVAPWSVNGRVAEGKILVGMNRYREALPLLRGVVTRHFNHKEAHRLLNYCYNRLGLRYEEAPELALLLERHPDSPPLQLQLADAHRRRGEHRKAIERYRMILDKFAPTQTRRFVAQTHVGMGRSLKEEGRRTKQESLVREATAAFRTGSTVDPTYLAAHVNLALTLRETGQEKEADEVIAHLRTIAPQNPEDWVALFEFYLRNGDPVRARGALDHALSLEPDNLKIMVDAGLLLIREDLHQEAAKLFEQAIVLNPSDKTLYNYRGICFRHLGHYDEALISYNAALAIDETDAAIHFNKGRVYEARGDKADAVKCYEDALFFDPLMPEAEERIARLAHRRTELSPPEPPEGSR